MNCPCEIIRDLLPLYEDQVCSAQSRESVEEHLAGCAACRAMLEGIHAEVLMPPKATLDDISAGDAMKVLMRRWKRSKVLVVLSWMMLAIVLLLAGSSLYNKLFVENSVIIPTAQMELAYLCRQPNGDLAMNFLVKDGKVPQTTFFQEVNCGWEETGRNEMYLTVKRPLIQLGKAPDPLTGTYTQEYTDDDLDTRLYYGTPGDAFLIWAPGMQLPVMTIEQAETAMWAKLHPNAPPSK